MAAADADEVRRLRDLTGSSAMDCRRAFGMAEEFGGDVVVALAVLHRAGIAIQHKGDRDAWNRQGAAAQAECWRAAIPGLAESFPPRSAGAPTCSGR
ncbi:hypothetical protein [Methylobacterium brachiatum]|jgi:translation elongation factor EF-Ts